MKIKLIAACAATLGAVVGLSAMAGAYRIENFKVSNPIPMTMPLMSDSLNPQGKAFDVADALKWNINLDSRDYRQMQVGDSTGVSLDKAVSAQEMSVLRTRVRANRYFKGKLMVKSEVPCVVYFDGKDVITKAAGQKEGQSAVTLAPEVTYNLDVRVLAQAADSVAPKVALELVPDKDYENVQLVSGADLKLRYTVNDCTLGCRVGGLAVSPDGKYVLMTYVNRINKDKTVYYTTVTDCATGKEVLRRDGRGLKWLPKGSTLYYVVDMAESKEVRAVDPDGRNDRTLAAGLPADADIAMWSPNMDYFVYYKDAEQVKEEGPLRRYTEQDDRMEEFRSRSFLVKYDMKQGVSQMLTYGKRTTYLSDISADGKKLLFMTNTTTPDRYPFYDMSLYSMDVNTLKTDTLVKADSYIRNAMFSPDGKQLCVIGGPQSFGGIGNNSGNHPIANDFDMQLFILNIADGGVKALSRDFNPAIVEGTAEWNRSDGRIYFLAEDGFYRRVYACSPTAGTFAQLPQQVGNIGSFSVGEYEGNWLAYFGQSYDKSGAAYLVNLKNNKERLLADPMADRLGAMELGKTEPWNFTAKDGSLIEGWICYPPEFDPAKKYPLIVYYYGGTSPSNFTLSSPYSPQVLASRDYVVYVLNPSGTTGYGQEFSARHVNAWGKQTAEEIVEGTKAFVKAHSFVDGKKIGCMGASYGGFMTQYLQTITDIFAAAVSHAGISNVTSYWGEGYWGYSYNSVAAAKSYPWSDPKLFTEQGSLFNADKIHTPLLLLHGTADTNVPIGESIQLFNALKILGRDVEFISVDGENHFVLDPVKRQLWQDTIMAWFAKWLQDSPQWWDSMYPSRNL